MVKYETMLIVFVVFFSVYFCAVFALSLYYFGKLRAINGQLLKMLEMEKSKKAQSIDLNSGTFRVPQRIKPKHRSDDKLFEIERNPAKN
mgnify:CR=1 FL=1